MTALRSIALDERTIFDDLREREYSRLDADNQAYLDFTGSALYADRQIVSHADRLRRSILGNPHSENGPSLVSTAIIKDAKAKLLRFLDASPEEYVVCFTANTSAAIRLVAESYPFGANEGLVLSSDNHNSMNGVREFARGKGAPVRYVPLDDELRLASPVTVLRSFAASGLFGFPAQSNFSGVKHPLSLICDAQRLGYAVLLDAAAFLPTNRLSLTRYPADFVTLSAYKLAGYPTSVGALVARRATMARLKRPWFAGGTVEYASVQHQSHLLSGRNGEGFEDGTPAFIDIAALADGLDFMDEIGIQRINAHVSRHRARFVSEIACMKSRAGRPLAIVYGPRSSHGCGATVAFNLIARDGKPVPFARVVERARNEGVSLRGGCFCNPGASEAAFDFPPDRTALYFARADGDGFNIETFSEYLGPDVAVGAVRASMGIATNDRDVDRALSVIRSFA
jgi:selenocysteine lyase/cysteine desulfurase